MSMDLVRGLGLDLNKIRVHFGRPHAVSASLHHRTVCWNPRCVNFWGLHDCRKNKGYDVHQLFIL